MSTSKWNAKTRVLLNSFLQTWQTLKTVWNEIICYIGVHCLKKFRKQFAISTFYKRPRLFVLEKGLWKWLSDCTRYGLPLFTRCFIKFRVLLFKQEMVLFCRTQKLKMLRGKESFTWYILNDSSHPPAPIYSLSIESFNLQPLWLLSNMDKELKCQIKSTSE